jgi:hypothetical protein
MQKRFKYLRDGQIRVGASRIEQELASFQNGQCTQAGLEPIILQTIAIY